jgi:hypothetical protein
MPSCLSINAYMLVCMYMLVSILTFKSWRLSCGCFTPTWLCAGLNEWFCHKMYTYTVTCTRGCGRRWSGITRLTRGCGRRWSGITRLTRGCGRRWSGITRLTRGCGRRWSGITRLTRGCGRRWSGITRLEGKTHKQALTRQCRHVWSSMYLCRDLSSTWLATLPADVFQNLTSLRILWARRGAFYTQLDHVLASVCFLWWNGV